MENCSAHPFEPITRSLSRHTSLIFITEVFFLQAIELRPLFSNVEYRLKEQYQTSLFKLQTHILYDYISRKI